MYKRQVFEYLRGFVDADIASAHLVISGGDVVLCDGDELLTLVRRPGQGVLNVLALGGVKQELDLQLNGPVEPDVAVDGDQGVRHDGPAARAV